MAKNASVKVLRFYKALCEIIVGLFIYYLQSMAFAVMAALAVLYWFRKYKIIINILHFTVSCVSVIHWFSSYSHLPPFLKFSTVSYRVIHVKQRLYFWYIYKFTYKQINKFNHFIAI